MASTKLTVTVPADYVGYTVMKFALRRIVEEAQANPFDTGAQDAAEMAEQALTFVAATEKRGP